MGSELMVFGLNLYILHAHSNMYIQMINDYARQLWASSFPFLASPTLAPVVQTPD